MSELPLDVAVANRFISSLSKSLQALCHGCMDFDSGIEIVGYINVNIDCGSKVDYVLNEKVSKSTNNSMTFVSNSFMAKKDQPKQTRDGACSPIPEFTGAHSAHSYYRQRGHPHSSWNRYGYSGSHQRGTHKRGYGEDWRGAPKRPRPIPSSTTTSAQFAAPLSSRGLPLGNESLNSVNFQQQQYTQHSGSFDTNKSNESESSEINIKKETFEGNEETHAHSESSEQKSSDFSELCGSVNIKSDPDGNPDSSNVNESKTQESGDFKGTFLQPNPQETQDNNKIAQTSESCDPKSVADQTVGFETSFPDPDSLSAAGENDAGSSANEALDKSSCTKIEGGESSDHVPVEYDTATEDTDYHDGGEGTSAGQFEVIEIDDEDEDMQAMFGTSHPFGHNSNLKMVDRCNPIRSARFGEMRMSSQTRGRSFLVHSQLANDSSTPGGKSHNCPYCPTVCPSRVGLQNHVLTYHGDCLPFVCSLCGKGYKSQCGLDLHLQVHEGRSFPCPIDVCPARFSQKSKVKRHLQNVHHAAQCSSCSGVFDGGREYNKHVLACGSFHRY